MTAKQRRSFNSALCGRIITVMNGLKGMNKTLIDLISSSYDDDEARKVESFVPKNSDVQELADAGKAVLIKFPNKAGACALMSAMWTAFVRDTSDHPVHAVAGELYVEGVRVFGSDIDSVNSKNGLSGENLDWDGHCWVSFGSLICDVSIFRTAYSREANPLLYSKIISAFGKGRGIMIMEAEQLEGMGFEYRPKYVLTDTEVTGLVKGAYSLIQKSST